MFQDSAFTSSARRAVGCCAFLSEAVTQRWVLVASRKSRSLWRARRRGKRENSSGKGSIRSTPSRLPGAPRRLSRAASKTFAECATKYIDAKSPEWANAKHLEQWRTTIETFANPVIGALFVQDVDTPHVMAILEPIWKTKLKPQCVYAAALIPSSIGQRFADTARG